MDCSCDRRNSLTKLGLSRLWKTLNDDSWHNFDITRDSFDSHDVLAGLVHELDLLVLAGWEVESFAVKNRKLLSLTGVIWVNWAVGAEF